MTQLVCTFAVQGIVIGANANNYLVRGRKFDVVRNVSGMAGIVWPCGRSDAYEHLGGDICRKQLVLPASLSQHRVRGTRIRC